MRRCSGIWCFALLAAPQVPSASFSAPWSLAVFSAFALPPQQNPPSPCAGSRVVAAALLSLLSRYAAPPFLSRPGRPLFWGVGVRGGGVAAALEGYGVGSSVLASSLRVGYCTSFCFSFVCFLLRILTWPVFSSVRFTSCPFLRPFGGVASPPALLLAPVGVLFFLISLHLCPPWRSRPVRALPRSVSGLCCLRFLNFSVLVRSWLPPRPFRCSLLLALPTAGRGCYPLLCSHFRRPLPARRIFSLRFVSFFARFRLVFRCGLSILPCCCLGSLPLISPVCCQLLSRHCPATST